MMRLKGMKRFLSVVLCAAILTGGVYSGTGVVKSVPVSAMTLAELQSEKQANADKIAKMQKELDDLGSEQQEQAGFQKTLEEKISLQQSNLQIVDEELTRLEDAITDKEQEICDLKNEVAALAVYFIAPIIVLIIFLFIGNLMRRYIPNVLNIVTGGRI